MTGHVIFVQIFVFLALYSSLCNYSTPIIFQFTFQILAALAQYFFRKLTVYKLLSLIFTPFYSTSGKIKVSHAAQYDVI